MSLAALMGITAEPQTIPIKVQAAMTFISMMRQTSIRPPAFDGGDPQESTRGAGEQSAYRAALDVLRTYFNGENEFASTKPPEPPPEPPTSDVPRVGPELPGTPAAEPVKETVSGR